MNKGQGLQRISAELQQKGIGKTLISRTLKELDYCWQTLCDEVIIKKLNIGHYGYNSYGNNNKDRAKMIRFLTSRGFSYVEIHHSMDKNFNFKNNVTTD